VDDLLLLLAERVVDVLDGRVTLFGFVCTAIGDIFCDR
jgi:hypothetical protein